MPRPTKYGVAIIDTNLIDYAFKSRTKDMAAQVLRKISQIYTLVISEYLRFEIYRGLAMDRISSAKVLVDSFPAYAVDKATLDTAAALTTCYERDPATKSSRKAIADGDIILAATAFINKFIIVTANRADFPAPYFDEIQLHKIKDQKGRVWAFYELRPDLIYLNSMLDVCYPKLKL